MRRLRGFTLVELMIVIAVIGILTTITVLGFNRYQQNARDTQRDAKATVIANALEKYYDQNGEYPSCYTLGNSSVTTLTGSGGPLQGVDKGAIVTPTSTASDSISCSDLTSASGPDVFAYVGDGSGTCTSQTTGGSCLGFTLKYLDETDGTVKTISSHHQVAAVTSGSTTLSVSGTSYSKTTLTWGVVPNAATYRIEYSTNNFSTVNSVMSATSPYQMTGLSNGTTYQMRVIPVTSSGDGTATNTVSLTTLTLSAPTLAVSPYNETQVNASWGAVSGATSYTIQRATDNGFTTNLVTTPNVTSTQAVTGLSTSTTYYFRIQSVNSETSSNWSNVVSIKPTIAPPTAPTVSASTSGNNAVGTAGTVTTCPTSTTPQYSLRYRSDNNGTPGSWSAFTTFSTSQTYSVGAWQGNNYTFEAQAQCVGATLVSPAADSGATASVVYPLSTPALPQMVIDGSTSGSRYWNNQASHTVSYNTFCPAGTSTVNGTYGQGSAGYSKASGFNWSDGVDYYRYYGQSVSWIYPSGYGSGSGIRYNAYYGCQTAYAYVQTGESYDVIYIVN